MEELRKVIELQTSELHELYTSSVGSSVDKSVVPFTHTDLISKCGQEIEKLKLQVRSTCTINESRYKRSVACMYMCIPVSRPSKVAEMLQLVQARLT